MCSVIWLHLFTRLTLVIHFSSLDNQQESAIQNKYTDWVQIVYFQAGNQLIMLDKKSKQTRRVYSTVSK